MSSPKPLQHPNAKLFNSSLWWLIGLLLFAHLGVLLIIGLITHGQPFTDDTTFQLEFIRDPLLLLFPRPESVYRPPFPPLSPLLMALAVRPFQWFTSDFYAIRLGYVATEVVALPLIWGAWARFSRTPRLRWLLGLAYVFSPMGMTVSAVLAQEETISLLFAAAAVWLVLEKRPAAAALVCGLGIVAGKVFLGIGLLAIVFGPPLLPWRQTLKRAALGFGPVAVVYLTTWYTGATSETSNSFDSFAPHNSMCVTLWSLLEIHGGLDRVTALQIAKPLAALAVLASFAVIRIRGPIPPGPWLVATMAAMFLSFYATFSHINPEHWLILAVMLPFAFRHRTTTLIFLVHFAVAIAINVTYGVAAAEGFATGRAPFVRLYNAVVPIDAIHLHTPLVLIFSVTSVGLAIAATHRAATRRPIGAPVLTPPGTPV